MASSPSPSYETVLQRYYIDTRRIVPPAATPKSAYTLPLLNTLQYADQEAVTRFIRPADRFMSLASALLKYYFIHRRAAIAWSDIHIARTPSPHRRPYWAPPTPDWSRPESDRHEQDGGIIRGLEFNVSHQAGMVALIGCATPTAQRPSVPPSDHGASPSSAASNARDHADHVDLTDHHRPTLGVDDIRLGVDIACTNEDKRTPKDVATQAKLDEWVDIFGEMFSDRERRDMKYAPVHVPVAEHDEADWPASDHSEDDTDDAVSPATAVTSTTGAQAEDRLVPLKLRRFYAYWGLKEAYIKMVGEGLLASWLRDLEFLDVVAPPPIDVSAGRVAGGADRPESAKWTPPANAQREITTLLHGRRVEDVDIELVAFEQDFIVATATRGVKGPTGSARGTWMRLDIEKDIRPCAEGTCRCLE